MGWEFIVEDNCEFITEDDSKKNVIEKINTYLNSLQFKDGFFTLSNKAKQNIKSHDYSIESYSGFVLNN